MMRERRRVEMRDDGVVLGVEDEDRAGNGLQIKDA